LRGWVRFRLPATFPSNDGVEVSKDIYLVYALHLRRGVTS